MAVHVYAVRPEYCHERRLWENIGNPARGDDGRKDDREQWISDLDVAANRNFRAISPMT